VAQFTALSFTELLKERRIKISMNGKSIWKDDIFMELLWRSLKYEYVYKKNFVEVISRRRALKKWVNFYSSERLHSSSGYRTLDGAYFASLSKATST